VACGIAESGVFWRTFRLLHPARAVISAASSCQNLSTPLAAEIFWQLDQRDTAKTAAAMQLASCQRYFGSCWQLHV